ncbi:MAG: 30S ribosomal protein S7 [Candidatus Wallbacteria bacterium HGW-Wallbacteria-1]|jgi:small subunit ribosomal protein S7|uniref:Small ribosomal subunit protein uS7 n=1 Tax=Candidatus Wallbacteria bacterium HGW-Wallbacteria-1 TaxID=2013854 RepID=A0A2N1PSY4_9BACT|nr:MAG: 30S ribosomal protein S7 [Candidatus Wallbacteria bacterium HGW-Wallbacteria-1]
MPRRKVAAKREILPDPIYNSVLVSKFINCIMEKGKKGVAEQIVYKALDIISNKMKTDNPLDLFVQAIEKAKPVLEVKSRRIGGATYQVPIEIREERRLALAFRWLKNYSVSKKGREMADRLADELMGTIKGESATAKKREDTHKMADANKAFAHYRW